MDTTLSLYETKTHFSAVAERVSLGGEHITVTKHGVPLLRLVPLKTDTATAKKERIAQSLKDLAVLQTNSRAKLTRHEILALKDVGRKW